MPSLYLADFGTDKAMRGVRISMSAFPRWIDGTRGIVSWSIVQCYKNHAVLKEPEWQT